MSAEVFLTLEDALWRKDEHATTPTQDVIIWAAMDRGKWFGSIALRALHYNSAWHSGQLNWMNHSGETSRLGFELNINRDQWVPGGKANYVVELGPPRGDRMEGTFSGTFNDVAVKGRAVGRLRRLPERTPPPPDDLRTISQPAGFVPGRGVPVVDIESRQLSGAWLLAGPFPVVDEATRWSPQTPAFPADLLAAIGGTARANPQAGTRVAVGDMVRTFEIMPDELVGPRWDGKASFDVAGAAEHVPRSTMFFYSIVRNDRPRIVSTHIDRWDTRMWLGGEGVREGEVVRLAAGLIPVLVEARIERAEPGPSWAALRLSGMPEGNENWERSRVVKGDIYAATQPAK